MTTKERNKLLEETIARLKPHFNSIQILATNVGTDGTEGFKWGDGDWYARQGMAHEFIRVEAAREMVHEFMPIMPVNPPDDSDDWKNG